MPLLQGFSWSFHQPNGMMKTPLLKNRMDAVFQHYQSQYAILPKLPTATNLPFP